MLNPLSMIGNGCNVRVSAECSNAGSSRPISHSYRQSRNGMIPSNFRCSAHEITRSEEMPLSQQPVNAVGNSSFHKDLSTLQPHICKDSTDGFELGNNFFGSIVYPYQENTITMQTASQALYFDPLSEDSLTGSPAICTEATPGGPKTTVPLSVGAQFQTQGQNDPASAGDESFVPPLIIGYPRFSPTLYPRSNLHGINIQHVLVSEDPEQFYAPDKTRKHVIDVPSHFLPENTWCYTFEESRANPTQCWPPSPLRIRWKLALQHLHGKEQLVRCRSSATICYIKR